MNKINKFIIILFIIVFSFVGCSKRANEKPSHDQSNNIIEDKICIIFDTNKPILMQPDIKWVRQLLASQGLNSDSIDLADEEYSIILKDSNLTQYEGLIIFLPYDFETEKYLIKMENLNIKIIQFGGDYYPNDISVSLNHINIGYQIGKKTGEIFQKKGNTSPKLGLYAKEIDWKEFERGFIEGISDVVPDTYIVCRKIVSMDNKTTIQTGEEDISELDGIIVYFWDEQAKAISYNDNIVQINVGDSSVDLNADNLIISMTIHDDETSKDAIGQFIEMIKGTQYTKRTFTYSSIFDFVIS